ncbi:hypothetical protein V8C35DRAFT_26442 [Trichoderma chlorosporum]
MGFCTLQAASYHESPAGGRSGQTPPPLRWTCVEAFVHRLPSSSVSFRSIVGHFPTNRPEEKFPACCALLAPLAGRGTTGWCRAAYGAELSTPNPGPRPWDGRACHVGCSFLQGISPALPSLVLYCASTRSYNPPAAGPGGSSERLVSNDGPAKRHTASSPQVTLAVGFDLFPMGQSPARLDVCLIAAPPLVRERLNLASCPSSLPVI